MIFTLEDHLRYHTTCIYFIGFFMLVYLSKYSKYLAIHLQVYLGILSWILVSLSFLSTWQQFDELDSFGAANTDDNCIQIQMAVKC